MASSSSTTCGGSIGHQLGIAIVLLSVALLSPGHALPRPSPMMGALPTQLLYNELLGNEDNSIFYADQLNYPTQRRQHQQEQQQQLQQQPQQGKQLASLGGFGNKWPSLRDLLLTADYDDGSMLGNQDESFERMLARLHRLSETGFDAGSEDQLRFNMIDDMTAMPAKKQSDGDRGKLTSTAKQHNIKKNVQFRRQYMSPCHFKICNMGRKRNAGTFVPY